MHLLISLLTFKLQLNLVVLSHCIYFILTLTKQNRAHNVKEACWKVVCDSSSFVNVPVN